MSMQISGWGLKESMEHARIGKEWFGKVVVPVAVELSSEMPHAEVLELIAPSIRESLLECEFELVALVVEQFESEEESELWDEVYLVLLYGKLEDTGAAGYYVVDTENDEVSVAELYNSDGTRCFPDGPLPQKEALIRWLSGLQYFYIAWPDSRKVIYHLVQPCEVA